MYKALIFILLSLLFSGCSQKNVRAYVPDDDGIQHIEPDKQIDLSEYDVALMVKSDHITFYPYDQHNITALPAMDIFFTTNDAELDKSRKDLVSFYVTARYLRMSNKPRDLEIFAEVAREYLSKRIDPLLTGQSNARSPEVRKALTELQYYKAYLLFEIEDMDGACETVSAIESGDHHMANEHIKVFKERLNKNSNPYSLMSDLKNRCK